MSYGYQSGDVLTDSSLPLSDVTVRLNSASMGYARTFGLFGKQANIAAFAPYVYAHVRGRVFEQETAVTRSGLADLRLRFSTMLVGAPALSPKEFAAHKPKTLIGVSLSVIIPTGQYDPARLVNIGSNRWSFKPEIGFAKPMGRWSVEGAAAVWFFTPNNNFFGGNKREQKPVLTLQAHVVYTIRPRMWVAVSGTYFNGGRTVVNHVLNADLQSNARYGATFSYPLNQRQSIKASFMRGLTTRIGGNLNSFTVGWQYTWF